MREMVDWARWSLMMLLVICVAMVVLLSAAHVVLSLVDMGRCEALDAMSDEYEYHWDFWAMCMVRTPSGLWVDVDEAQYFIGEFDISLLKGET